MTIRILYIMRSPGPSPSIERVFRQIGKCLSSDEFEFDFQELPDPTTSVNLLLNLLRFRPRRADIYHVTGDVNYISLRLPRSRTVLTIHDLIFLHVRSGIRRYALKKLLLTWPLRRLQYVTAISEATKNEIVGEAGPAGDKVRIIENPLFDGFDAEPRRRFDPGEPIILHIGTAPNKNLDKLVDALTGLQCRLRIIGELNDSQREHLVRSGVSFSTTAGLSQEQMADEYRKCDILSFCTTYEGFGLPVIEAQAMMKPVLASNIEPIASIAGRGAFLVDPHRPAAIREGLLRLIGDEALRNSLVEMGRQNVTRFDPMAISKEYASIYRMIAGRGEQQIMKVLVLGVTGMLGHKLFQALSGSFDVWGTVRRSTMEVAGSGSLRTVLRGVDALDFSTVETAIDRVRPSVVINAIGVVKQLKKASDEDLLTSINAEFPRRLVNLAASRGARVIHISTDCVFSGRKGNYSESDVPDPIDAYGASKLKGEVIEEPCLTLRTSFVGRELTNPHGLVEWFLSKRGSRVHGFADAFFSGLTTHELARVIRTIIHDHPNLTGLYHVSGPRISKYEFLCLLNALTGADIQVIASQEPSIDRSLDSTRFRSAVNWAPPTWEHMLDELASEIV